MNRAIHPRKKYKILKKFGFKCAKCQKSSNEIPLEIDHIVPISSGGNNEDSNLQVLCYECNMKKYNHSDEYLINYLTLEKNLLLLSPIEKLNIVKTILLRYIHLTWEETSIALSYETEINILCVPHNKLESLFKSMKKEKEEVGFKNEKKRKILEKIQIESYKERVTREKMERWDKISNYSMQGRTHAEIAVLLGVSTQTIRKTLKEIDTYNKIINCASTFPPEVQDNTNI